MLRPFDIDTGICYCVTVALPMIDSDQSAACSIGYRELPVQGGSQGITCDTQYQFVRVVNKSEPARPCVVLTH